MLGGNQNNNNNLIVLKVKDSVKDEGGNDVRVPPFFQVSRRNEEKKFVVDGQETRVEGTLRNIVAEEKEWDNPKSKKKEKYHVIKVTLDDEDADETYLLDLRLNILTRSLLNNLLSAAKGDLVSISLYEKDGWSRAGVRVDGELTDWKFKAEDIPKPSVIKDEDGEVVKKNYKKVDQFFLDAIEEFTNTKVPDKAEDDETPVVTKPAAKRGRKPKAAPEPVAEDDSDDIPF